MLLAGLPRVDRLSVPWPHMLKEVTASGWKSLSMKSSDKPTWQRSGEGVASSGRHGWRRSSGSAPSGGTPRRPSSSGVQGASRQGAACGRGMMVPARLFPHPQVAQDDFDQPLALARRHAQDEPPHDLRRLRGCGTGAAHKWDSEAGSPRWRLFWPNSTLKTPC